MMKRRFPRIGGQAASKTRNLPMRRLTGFALAASLSLVLLSTAANAAAIGVFRGPSPGSNGNGAPACTVDCVPLPSAIVVPPRLDCAAPVRLNSLANRVIVRRPCKPGINATACGQKLGNLRRVTVSQVRRIDDSDHVHLVPICDNLNRSLTEQEMSFLARGNVQGLLRPIGQNATLEAALADGGYRADDVIGVVLNPRAVTLYVSRARAGR
jgi:hypothetical protein